MPAGTEASLEMSCRKPACPLCFWVLSERRAAVARFWAGMAQRKGSANRMANAMAVSNARKAA